MEFKLIVVLFLVNLVGCSSIDDPNTLTVDGKSSPEKPLIVRSIDKDKGLPKETQMAQCTVSSGDIKASAQATFSKKLEGFCSTKDMSDLRENLAGIEARLFDEIHYLKLMIRDLLPRNSQYLYDNYQNYRQRPMQSNYQQNKVQQTFSEPQKDNEVIRNVTTPKPIETTSNNITPLKTPEVVNVMKSKLKSLKASRSQVEPVKQLTSPTPNATSVLITDAPPAKNEYTYYWKLENFPKTFIYAKKNEIFSHVFNVKGLFLRVRAMLRPFDEENLILNIEHLANIKNVDKMEIEISDGLVFQEIAEEKLFQYSFAIMDQTRPNHDLISPIYWNTEADNFLVPNSVHLLANYVKNDSLLIKLNIMF